MLPKLTFHLSSLFPRSQIRIFSTLSPDQIKLKYLYSKANSDLSIPSSIPSAINTFKSLTLLTNQMFQDIPLQRSYWCSLSALKLSERNLLNQSQDFLEEGIKALNQNKASNSPSKEFFEVCFIIGQTLLFHSKVSMSEEFFIKCYSSIESVEIQRKMALFEKLIPVEMILNRNSEVVKFCEEALKYFESISEKRQELIRILACYAKALVNLKDFEKAVRIARKSIPLICMEEKNTDLNRFIIDAYYILVEAYAGIGIEDEAIEAVLAGGKVIEKWFDGNSALAFYDNILNKYEFGKGVEDILKAFIELNEKTLR